MAKRSVNMKRRVQILRPAIELDVTTIRDPIVRSHTSIATDVRCYIEVIGSDRVQNGQLGYIAVDRFVAFFPAGTNVKVNDVLKEVANRANGNVLTYWDVVGVMDYDTWLVRVDLEKKNYHRGS